MTTSAGVVTVLFTDVVGSTELLDRLGDDAAEELRRTHFNVLRRAVADTGGREVKSMGDGLMVAFTSPFDALRCAVAMQRAIAEHNRQAGLAIEVRIGVHAGEPIPDEDDLQGTAVVVAKRLCDQAKGGQILASQIVADLVGSTGRFSFRSLGRLRLKGLAQPVASVAVDWDPSARSGVSMPAPAASAPRRPGPEIVGREKELALLDAELERAAQGEFRCVLIVGEPGVGKSRLCTEVVVRAAGAVIGLLSRAYPLGDTASFGLWAEALEAHLRGLEPDEVTRLAGGFLDDLAALVRSVAALRGSAPDREPPRHRLLDGLSVVFGNLAREKVVVVVLDDVHLGDASSWEAMHYLARHLADARLLVIATARPAELAEHPVAAQVLFALEQDGALRQHDLVPLDSGGVRDLAKGLLASSPSPALVEWLFQRSRGNALFTVGLVRALLDEGADLAAPRLARLPEGLAERVRVRVAHLDESSRSLLELVAVFGRRVELGPLLELVESSVDASAALERLVASRLITEQELNHELTYEIAHPLVQEAIYQGIGGARRRHLHRLAARALLTAGQLGEAAPHFARSSRVGDAEAIEGLLQAVRQAEERQAYREALEILGALIEILPPRDKRWLEVADAISWEAEWVVDHRADVHAIVGVKAMRAVDAVLEGSSDILRRAAVKSRLASFLAWGTGEFEEAEQLCRDGIDLYERGGDAGRSRLARLELAYLEGLARGASALETGPRAVLADAEAAADEFATLQAVGVMGTGLLYLGRFGEAEAALRRSLELAREQSRLYRVTWTLCALGWSLGFEGRVAEAMPCFEEAKADNPSWRDSNLLEIQAIVEYMAGHYGGTAGCIREAAAWNTGGMSRRRAASIPFAALAAAEMAQLDDAGRYVAMARDIFGGRPWVFGLPYCDYADAMIDWQQGRPSRSVAGLRDAAADLLSGRWVPFAALPLADLAELAAEMGDASTASEGARLLAEIAEHTERNLYRGLAAIGAAWSARVSGSGEGGVRQATLAVNALSDTGCRAFLGRAFHVLGCCLVTTDRARGTDALVQAASLFDACGAAWRQARVQEILRALPNHLELAASRHGRLGGVVAPRSQALTKPRFPDSLTAREVEILKLLATGLTSGEVAAELCLSVATIQRHIANIYGKIGVRNRAEATAYALRHQFADPGDA